MFAGWVPDDFYEYLEFLPDLQRLVNFFMTFTPLFSYGTTCYGIYTKKTSVGFSIDICATMMMASILRILYYIISPYEITLLRQSVVQIIIQTVLLHVSLKYRPANYDPDFLAPIPVFTNELNSNLPSRLSATNFNHETYDQNGLFAWVKSLVPDLLASFSVVCITIFHQVLRVFDVYYQRPGHFWQWKETDKYWKFIGLFALTFSTLTLVFYNSERYSSFIGILGLYIESLLPLPQILLLNRLKSTKNFKLLLLFSWYGGDLTKISYLLFGTNDVSIIFILAGLFQMSLDIFIGCQYIHFKYYYQESPQPIRFEVGDGDEENLKAPFNLENSQNSIEMRQLQIV